MFSRRRLRGAESSLAARVAVGGVALAAGMTACGGGSDAQSSQVPQAVQSAYKTTTSAETVTISLKGSQQGSQTSGAGNGQGQGQQSSISGEAALNFAQNASSTTVDAQGQNDTETRTIENVLYRKIPEGQRQQVPGKKPWIKVNLQQVAQVQYGDRASEMKGNPPNDPAGILTYLRGVTGATEQGSAQVRDTQTTHYQTTVNLQKATKGQGPQVEQQAQQLQQQLGKPKLPMQLWLDDQGRVRKLETKLPAGGGGQGPSASPSRILVTEEFYDYGESVDVSAPDDGDTADVTQQIVQRTKMQQQMQQRQQQQGSPQPNQS